MYRPFHSPMPNVYCIMQIKLLFVKCKVFFQQNICKNNFLSCWNGNRHFTLFLPEEQTQTKSPTLVLFAYSSPATATVLQYQVSPTSFLRTERIQVVESSKVRTRIYGHKSHLHRAKAKFFFYICRLFFFACSLSLGVNKPLPYFALPTCFCHLENDCFQCTSKNKFLFAKCQ